MWTTLRFFQLLGLSVLLGGMSYFSFIVAPTLFRGLPREQAGDIVSLLFPGYYLLSAIAIAVTLAASAFLFWREGAAARSSLASIILLGVMLIAMLYAGQVITPRAHQLKEESRIAQETPRRAEIDGEFNRLHRLAVRLNGFVLILALVLLGMLSSRLRI